MGYGGSGVYTMTTTATMTRRESLDKLTGYLKRAAEAAKAADPGPDADGGTCNFDSPAFRLDRVPQKDIEAAAEAAGVRVVDFTWFAGSRWFWLSGVTNGQGNRRTRMMEAAQAVLDEAAAEIPCMCSSGYYQMD
jgi:hypothetical protein